MTQKANFFLLIILLFASFNYLFRLTDFPSGFYQNEASFGYNAYSLLKTGKDEYGRKFPLVLESFGDYKLAFYSYFLIPFILIFSLTEYTVRFSAVFAGLVSVLTTYLIICNLFKSQRLALMSSLFLTVSPWLTVFSRTGNETILAVALFYISIILFLKGIKSSRFYIVIISCMVLTLSILAYYSAWLPSIFFIFTIFYLSIRKGAGNLFKSAIYIIPLVLIGIISVSQGSGRLKQINILEHSGSNLILNEQIREDQSNFPVNLIRAFHNKLTLYPQTIIANLSENLNLKFLFTNGDEEEKVYRIPNSGVLFPVLLPITTLGAFYLIKKYSLKINLIVFGLLFTGLLGSAASTHGSVAQRTLIISPIFALLGAFGLVSINKFFKVNKIRNISFCVLITLFVYESIFFYHQYFYHSSIHQPWYRNFGAGQMVEKVNSLSIKYNKTYISGNPYIFFYFYNKTVPQLAQMESKNLLSDRDSLDHQIRARIGKYYVFPIDCPAAGKKGILYVCRGNKIPSNSDVIDVIYYNDSQPAYIFIDFNHNKNNNPLPKNIEFMKHYGLIESNQSSDWLPEESIL